MIMLVYERKNLLSTTLYYLDLAVINNFVVFCPWTCSAPCGDTTIRIRML